MFPAGLIWRHQANRQLAMPAASSISAGEDPDLSVIGGSLNMDAVLEVTLGARVVHLRCSRHLYDLAVEGLRTATRFTEDFFDQGALPPLPSRALARSGAGCRGNRPGRDRRSRGRKLLPLAPATQTGNTLSLIATLPEQSRTPVGITFRQRRSGYFQPYSARARQRRTGGGSKRASGRAGKHFLQWQYRRYSRIGYCAGQLRISVSGARDYVSFIPLNRVLRFLPWNSAPIAFCPRLGP